jgi:hypothetical protein
MADCPTPPDLQRLLAGELIEPSLRVHVGKCCDCQSILEPCPMIRPCRTGTNPVIQGGVESPNSMRLAALVTVAASESRRRRG